MVVKCERCGAKLIGDNIEEQYGNAYCVNCGSRIYAKVVQIEITEVLQKVVPVVSDDEDATVDVHNEYSEGEITLDYNDFKEASFDEYTD